MYSLTYDLWNKIVDEAVDAHAGPVEALKRAAGELELSRSLIKELRLKGAKNIGLGGSQFLISIELYEDEIGGFKISLLASESVDAFRKMEDRATNAHGVSSEQIRGFEAEHGLDLTDEILDKIEEEYGVILEETESSLVFELVVFDSEDIDDHIGLDSLS